MMEYLHDSDDHELAVIIPAYRAKYLNESLDSLCAQTDKRFRVYVGDDASPDDLKQICDNYQNRLYIYYKRFNDNLGQTSLVQHWNRCARLSNERWCWLFCDDDIMHPRCVESFYRTIEGDRKAFPVYRFNTSMISAEGKIFKINPDHPEIESGMEFALARFKRERSSFVSEYIFSRQAFDSEGGFIDFPMAWCSDDASWIAFSGNKGIYTINGPRVLWRYSGFNISSIGNAYRDQKIEALFQFLKWVKLRIKEKTDLMPKQYDIYAFQENILDWLYYQLASIGPLGLKKYFLISKRMNSIFDKNRFQQFFGLLMVDYKLYKSRIKNKLSKIKRSGFIFGLR